MAEGKHLVGVDIGSSSIKIVELKSSRKGLEIIRAAYAPLPAQTIIDGHIMNRQAVVDTLADLWTAHKFTRKDVAVALYGQSVIVRKITVPTMTEAELEQQIDWEAKQHIPFDVKGMSIDYEVLRRRPEAGQMDLLLVAAKKDEVGDFTTLLKGSEGQATRRRHPRVRPAERVRVAEGPAAGGLHRAHQRGRQRHLDQHRVRRRVGVLARDHQRR